MTIKQDNNRNEPRPPIGEGNRFPDGGVADPRAYGQAGLRLLLDRVLQGIDGLGEAQFQAAGTSVREIAEQRDSATYLLERVVRNDGRRARRQRHRSAALRLLGHLHAAGQAELIAEIARSPNEPVTNRAAAFDALGMLGDPAATDVVVGHVEDEDDRIATRAIWALGHLGGPEDLADLEARLERTPAGARYEATLGAVAALGVRLGVPVAIPERDRRKAPIRRTTEVTGDNLV
jgi:hypothetical protein